MSTSVSIMTKPTGAICNLDCHYCFYLEKERLYPENKSPADFFMTDAVLENYVKSHIAHHSDIPEITFAWQGGEPTLMGLDFFRRVVQLQTQYCPPTQKIANALQTNGTLLNDDWCEFFQKNGFLIGLSIDGPQDLHDKYRVNKGGHGTHAAVMRAWGLLKKHDVQYNTLTVVNHEVSQRPLDVYDFLTSNGSRFLQFIPLVERATPQHNQFAEPPKLGAKPTKFSLPLLNNLDEPVTPWSVRPEAFGNFICQIFDRWVRRDVGEVFVQLFDVQLGIEMGLGSTLCVFSETCGRAVAMEHNGDLYSCDHYVYPQFKLGNINHQSIEELVASPQQVQFGLDKRDTLPDYCMRCDVKQHCNGECPKHRFISTPDGEPGLNYLCAGYKKIFHHMKPALQTMAALLRQGRPACDIMTLGNAPAPSLERRADFSRHEIPIPANSRPGRNDPCPCGSGIKFKKCCALRK